jgi:hypothetical protein
MDFFGFAKRRESGMGKRENSETSLNYKQKIGNQMEYTSESYKFRGIICRIIEDVED